MTMMMVVDILLVVDTMNDDDDNAQDDCDQDAVANMDDICPCDPTKSVTDFRGLVPHEVWIEMMMMMMVVVMLMMMVMTAMSMLIDSY